MPNNVPNNTKADQNKKVVGLQYEPGKGLPKVSLKGGGQLAEAILNKAREHSRQVPIVQDELLLQQLYQLPVDADIAPELFELVAILLGHIYAVDGKLQKGSI